MGRLNPSARLIGPFAVKGVPPEPGYGPAFAPGVRVGPWFVMPRGRPARPRDLPFAIDLLRDHVWSGRPPSGSSDWRWRLLAHLDEVYPSDRLRGLVAAIDAPNNHRIHGDATLANLVVYPVIGPRWIDPLERPWVPGDPMVDVGKMLQSAHGYEAVLAGDRGRFDARLAALALDGADPAARERANVWLLVHLARLLRYHTRGVQRWALAVLRDRGCELA